MSSTSPPATPQPYLVALAAWALPGLGYILIGQKTRGITVGVVIVLLFVFGLLIGGARSLEVPMVEREEVQIHRLTSSREIAEKPRLMDEIRSKPWSIAQVFTGPVAIAGGYLSAWAGTVDPQTHKTPGVESHARVNEIAVLYTAVAGMLNLLAIIDSAHRAGRLLEHMQMWMLPPMLDAISLAQETPPPPAPYAWKPFLNPMPAWSDHAWPWLLLPLCIGVAIVYKSIKCGKMKQVPKEATVLTIWILAGMAIAALALALIVEGMERTNM